MIPKVIHYCWFGRNPLPASAQKCIASWRKFLPDYEIREWNEDNFDVNIIPYTAQAYQARKWAFVSDYARMWILYHHGGLYFDTDVEVIAPMDDIIRRGPFMGIEVPGAPGQLPKVNPGLGLGVEPGHPIYRALLDHYANQQFLDADGNILGGTVVTHNTQVLAEHGLQPTNDLQQVDGIWIYPIDYFNPLDDATGRLNKTANTRSIHWYSKTWVSNYGPVRLWVTRWIHRLFGVNSLAWLKRR